MGSLRTVKLLAVAGAATVFAAGSAALAAPATYQTAVLADNPYLYYRLGETGALKDTDAANLGSSTSPGVYRGDLTGGTPGDGLLSDTAVSFPGKSTTGLEYLRTTDARGFGSLLGASSYEFIFKVNTPGDTAYQSLFGVFSKEDKTVTPNRTGNGAVAVELNSNATGNPSSTTSRFYVRDEAGLAYSGHIDNGSLMDGNYHHLVFTLDSTDLAGGFIKAYVDGAPVTTTLTYQGGAGDSDLPGTFLDFTVDPTFAARNVRGTVGNDANVTLDEVVLYTHVLSSTQVLSHYQSVVPEPASLSLLSLASLGLVRRQRRA